MPPTRPIVIRGAHEHNLRQVCLELPRHQLTVVTGVSGSGKSSLAYDTLYREGQRRYLSTLSSHARQFMDKLAQPSVEQISALPAALAVDQRTVIRSPRSTVGTMTELYGTLRLLYARLGRAHCARCGEPLQPVDADALLRRVVAPLRRRDPRTHLLAPVVDGHHGALRAQLERLRRAGLPRARVDGAWLELDPLPRLAPKALHQLQGDLGQLGQIEDLPAAVHRALALGRGVLVLLDSAGESARYSSGAACLSCGAPGVDLGPRLFSFNSPFGACPACDGLGLEEQIDPRLLVADPQRSVRQGALRITTPTGYLMYSQVTMEVLNQVCQAHGFHVDIPWSQLTEEQRRVILYGSDRITIPYGKHTLESRMRWTGIKARPRQQGLYRGIVPVMAEILARSRNPSILRFARSQPCSACHGSRLRPEALAVTFDGVAIDALCRRSLTQLSAWLEQLAPEPAQRPLLAPLTESMTARLALLERLGLGHLSLDRPSPTLSGGEAKRIRLAGQVLAGLQGLLYVLDEPSVGLHPRDMDQLIGALHRLRDRGNTVVVVEHDLHTMEQADWLVDIGPGPGDQGGRVVFAGPPELAASAPAQSPTCAALARARATPPLPGPRPATGATLWIRHARAHNLAGIDVPLRLGALNVVTGVSGSGKSSLVRDVLARGLRALLQGDGGAAVPGRLELPPGHQIATVLEVDQSPIGRTPRSNAATYTKVYDAIRSLYARQPLARQRGFNAGHFSFNTKGGRCEQCQGAGVTVVGLHVLADVEVPCPACEGRRFGPDTLQVRYRDHSVADVLELAVDQAAELFADQTKILPRLAALQQVGLGYLRLGQPSTTLSGGEAQRVKLAAELGRGGKRLALVVLDEPTTGLHPADVSRLLDVLAELSRQGHTLVVVEHDLAVMRAADWIVDLGPESGEQGGQLVACGTAAELARAPESHTGRALARLLDAATDDEHRGPAPHSTAATAVRQPQSAPAPTGRDAIELRGVRTHNLHDLDLTIPHGQLTVVTGVSGSGKSSLVLDTLGREGQRRYAECLSTRARRLLGQLPRPGLDSITGLSPVVALTQRGGDGPRSITATVAGVLDDLRLLYARTSTPHCPRCQQALQPCGDRARCADGACGLEVRWPLSASAFSFNRDQGACPGCKGLGRVLRCDPDRLVSHPRRSLLDGALDGTKVGAAYGERDGQHLALLQAAATALGHDLTPPWCELSAEARSLALDGAPQLELDVTWRYRRGKRRGTHRFRGQWLGLRAYVEQEYRRTGGDQRAADLVQVMSAHRCPECAGERLQPLQRAARVAGHTLPALCQMSVDSCCERLSALARPAAGASASRQVRALLTGRIVARLLSVRRLGLGYLTLDRDATTLSSGELKRLRLAGQLMGQLSEVTYLLDEPTAGLHGRDRARLLQLLRQLVADGNTVVAVTHDLQLAAGADHLLELGPGAGAQGGTLVASGPPPRLARDEAARYSPTLFGGGRPPRALRGQLRPGIQIRGAVANNLRQIDVELPLGGLVAVSGVSGAGKSSLLRQVLHASAEAGRAVACSAIDGLERVGQLQLVDRQLSAAGPHSTVASAIGAFDAIRALFANTRVARERGLERAHFALARKGGRCEVCQGTGRVRLDLGYLAHSEVRCQACHGTRYDAELADCRFREHSIAQLLQLSVAQAARLLHDRRAIASRLGQLLQAGLGYLPLGQSSATLSGGEAQRLRLARALAPGTDQLPTLFLLEEPTLGLHPDDVQQLLQLLDALLAAGHSLVVVEHSVQLLAQADWIVDLGPEAGTGGGRMVASGPPQAIARAARSHTGALLRQLPGLA